jgi:hypothetical protein
MKKLLISARFEHGVKFWGREGRLQENDKINNMPCKEVMKEHRLLQSIRLNENL